MSLGSVHHRSILTTRENHLLLAVLAHKTVFVDRPFVIADRVVDSGP